MVGGRIVTLTWRCEVCREESRTLTGIERHCDKAGHHRYSLVGLGLLLLDDAP
jgi:hypothetical protein